jgi:hypothetical protein
LKVSGSQPLRSEEQYVTERLQKIERLILTKGDRTILELEPLSRIIKIMPIQDLNKTKQKTIGKLDFHIVIIPEK